MRTSSKTANQKRNRPKGKNRHAKKRGDNPITKIQRGPFLSPERIRVQLQFVAHFQWYQASSKESNYVFRPSSPFDVDPAVGGANSYGFAEYSNFYFRYRTHSSSITVDASNLDNEGTCLWVVPSVDNPGNNISNSAVYFTNPNCHYKMLGSYNGNAAGRVKHYCTTQSLAGVDDNSLDSYSSLCTANPASNWYWVVGLLKTPPSNFTYGAALIVKIKIFVEFFERRTLATQLELPHRPVVGNSTPSFPAPLPVYIVEPPVTLADPRVVPGPMVAPESRPVPVRTPLYR